MEISSFWEANIVYPLKIHLERMLLKIEPMQRGRRGENRLAHLTLSIKRMVDWIWVKARKLIWREENTPLSAFYLTEKVLLFIIVGWCQIPCIHRNKSRK